jgi:hypothetical protein
LYEALFWDTIDPSKNEHGIKEIKSIEETILPLTQTRKELGEIIKVQKQQSPNDIKRLLSDHAKAETLQFATYVHLEARRQKLTSDGKWKPYYDKASEVKYHICTCQICANNNMIYDVQLLFIEQKRVDPDTEDDQSALDTDKVQKKNDLTRHSKPNTRRKKRK